MTNLLQSIDLLLEGMVEQQRAKALDVARAIMPGLTADDIQTPEAWPALYADGPFNYEDGIINGLLSAQTAIRFHLLQQDRRP